MCKDDYPTAKRRNSNSSMQRSLSTCLRRSTSVHPCCRWDILGLAEVRGTGFGETTTDEGHKIWYCGEDSRHQYGWHSLYGKKVVSSIINCTPICSRLLSIRISARPHIEVIQVYAPANAPIHVICLRVSVCAPVHWCGLYFCLFSFFPPLLHLKKTTTTKVNILRNYLFNMKW